MLQCSLSHCSRGRQYKHSPLWSRTTPHPSPRVLKFLLDKMCFSLSECMFPCNRGRVFSCLLCTCSPLVDRFPKHIVSVRKPSRTTPVSPHCSHDHTLILMNEREERIKEIKISFKCQQKYLEVYETAALMLWLMKGIWVKTCLWMEAARDVCLTKVEEFEGKSDDR